MLQVRRRTRAVSCALTDARETNALMISSAFHVPNAMIPHQLDHSLVHQRAGVDTRPSRPTTDPPLSRTLFHAPSSLRIAHTASRGRATRQRADATVGEGRTAAPTRGGGGEAENKRWLAGLHGSHIGLHFPHCPPFFWGGEWVYTGPARAREPPPPTSKAFIFTGHGRWFRSTGG